MELEEGGRYSWGLSLEAEFEDNTNWNLDSSDDEEFDALYSKEVLRDIEQLETMVQMCTNALSPNAEVFDGAAENSTDPPADIIRADDPVEEDLQQLPSISNLKSRFETQQLVEDAVQEKQHKPSSPQKWHVTTTTTSTTRTSNGAPPEKSVLQINGVVDEVLVGDEPVVDELQEVVRESHEKEEIHFEQMNSVRSMFERSSSEQDNVPPSPTKKASKWDKPKGPPPPPVNRPVDENCELELDESDFPEPAITSNLVAKFKELEQTQEELPPAELKPIRKITPPREEIRQDIEQFIEEQEIERDPDVVRYDDQGIVEEELPPPESTKNLLAKFRSMESLNPDAPPPIPQVVDPTTRKKSESSSSSRQYTYSASKEPETVYREEAVTVEAVQHEYEVVENGYIEGEEQVIEGGVFENEPVQSPDVIRESDRNDEEELPQQGLTRNLLAQWRQMELERDAQKTMEASPPAKQTTSYEWSYKKNLKPEASEPPPVVRSYITHSDEEEDVDGGQQRVVEEFTEVEGGVYENEPVYQPDVVRESDRNEEDDLPRSSITKNILAEFRKLEAEANSEAIPVTKKQFKWEVKEVRPQGRPVNVKRHEDGDDYDGEHEESYSEERFYEEEREEEHRTPYVELEYERDESIVRSDVPADREDELPPPAYAKNLLAKFRSMEDVSLPPPSPQKKPESASSRHSSSSRYSSYNRISTSQNGDLDDHEQQRDGHYDVEYADEQEVYHQYEQEAEAGEFENDPERDPDVIREGDRFNEDEIPAEGTTRSLLAKWSAMQA